MKGWLVIPLYRIRVRFLTVKSKRDSDKTRCSRCVSVCVCVAKWYMQNRWRIVETIGQGKKRLLTLKIERNTQVCRADFLCGTKSDEGATVGPLKFRIIRRVGKRFVGFSDFNRLTAFNAHFLLSHARCATIKLARNRKYGSLRSQKGNRPRPIDFPVRNRARILYKKLLWNLGTQRSTIRTDYPFIFHTRCLYLEN